MSEAEQVAEAIADQSDALARLARAVINAGVLIVRASGAADFMHDPQRRYFPLDSRVQHVAITLYVCDMCDVHQPSPTRCVNCGFSRADECPDDDDGVDCACCDYGTCR